MFKWNPHIIGTLKEQVFTRTPDRYKKSLRDECFRINLARMLVMSIVLVLLTALGMFSYFLTGSDDPARFTLVLLVHVVYIVIFCLFYFFCSYITHKEISRDSFVYRHLVMLFTLVYLSCEFALLFVDPKNISAYLRYVAALFVGLCVFLRPRGQSILFAVFIGVCTLIAVSLYPPTSRLLGAYFVFALFLLLFATQGVSLLSYTSVVIAFASRTRVSEANDHLQGLNQELQHLSHTDQLTGVGNRRDFEEKLSLAWIRGSALGEPLSVLMFDVDFFKAYNDFFTHPVGDKCLVSIAHCIREHLHRKGDIVCRYGGEEFVVILPETDRDTAGLLAERIRAGVEDLHIATPPISKRPYVTVSIGVAACNPKDGGSPQRLVDRADKAMYKSKQSGRNMVTLDK